MTSKRQLKDYFLTTSRFFLKYPRLYQSPFRTITIIFQEFFKAPCRLALKEIIDSFREHLNYFKTSSRLVQAILQANFQTTSRIAQDYFKPTSTKHKLTRLSFAILNSSFELAYIFVGSMEQKLVL